MTLTSQDLLVVKNLEDHDLKLTSDGRTVIIPAGAAKQVPFDSVRINFGDPRSQENPGMMTMPNGEKVMIPSRGRELKRLELWYGINGIKGEAVAKGDPSLVKELSDVAPKVEITTVDGEPVDTVISDPSGENPVAIPVDLDSQSSLANQQAQLQRQMDAVNARLRDLEGQPTDAPAAAADEVTEDSPSQGAKVG